MRSLRLGLESAEGRDVHSGLSDARACGVGLPGRGCVESRCSGWRDCLEPSVPCAQAQKWSRSGFVKRGAPSRSCVETFARYLIQ